MTFYEAALRVLEDSGTPLHSIEITRRAVEKGLLAHIGKTPEVTMLSRLAAIAKRPRDRKLMVTAKDTFALTDWLLPEDAMALAETGEPTVNEEKLMPPYRSSERHPEPRAEYLRAIGRQAERKRREDDGRRKRFPPIAEVVFEMLQEGQGTLEASDMLARMKAKELVGDELKISDLFEMLADDNQRRIDGGRRPAFLAAGSLEQGIQLSLDSSQTAAQLPVEIQQAFCLAVGIGFENGRAALKTQRTETRQPALVTISAQDDVSMIQQTKHAVRDARRAMARNMRRRLAELDAATFERACVKMLHAMHFRELKVSKRHKDGPLVTARKRDGSLELRYAIRMVRGSAAVERRQVQDLRRDLSAASAHVALLLTSGEARGDARSEALSGGPMVMLWCGDALSEKFFDASVGVSVIRLELFELEESFFEQAKKDAEDATKRREERHRDRSAQKRPTVDRSMTEPAAQADVFAVAELPGPSEAVIAGDDDDEDDSGDESPSTGPEGAAIEGAAVGEAGDATRRRRKRRRRRRRGAPRPEGGVVVAGPTEPAVEGAPSPEAAPEMPHEKQESPL